MAKLPASHKFFDLSDYGRAPAVRIAYQLKGTSVTPIHVTGWFIISGLLAIFCILNGNNFAAAGFLVLKSILDAADGELSRVKNTPSYVGRYFDSIADILLNFLFLGTIAYVTDAPVWQLVLAFVGLQLQGTLYNYYYVILRNAVNGDQTSRVFEVEAPLAMEGEKQTTVNLFFNIYNSLYILFDKAIYSLDKDAISSKPFPKWFMTILSFLGLGSQLLLMSLFLVMDLTAFILPFFILYTALVPVLVVVRRLVLSSPR